MATYSKPAPTETPVPTETKGAISDRARETSITAHVVRMGTVTMAFAELDAIVNMLRDSENSSQVAYEFIQAVESIW